MPHFSTAVHTLNGGVPKGCRTIHILRTRGELTGVMQDTYLATRHPKPGNGSEYSVDVIEMNISKDMHCGGDLRLVADFAKTMKGKTPSISYTSLKDSIYGHCSLLSSVTWVPRYKDYLLCLI